LKKLSITFLKIACNHTVARNAFALSFLQGINYFVPLLVLPYLSRILGVEKFGVVAVVMASIQLAYVMTDFGFSLSATYSISKDRNNKEKVSSLIGSVFFAKVFLVCISSVGMYIIPSLTKFSENKVFFSYAIIAIIAQAFQPIWFFQGIERMKNITIYMTIAKLLYAVLVFLLVKDASDAVWVVIGWGIAQSVATIISIWHVYREGYSINLPSIASALSVLRDGLQYFGSRVAVSLYTSASTMIVGMAGGTAQAAQFSVCEQIYKAGQNLSTPINQAMFPYMTNEKNWRFFWRVLSLVTITMVVGCIFLAAFSQDILGSLFGHYYKAASPVLMIFLIMIVVNYLGSNFGYPACAAIQRPDIANKTVIIGSTIHLLVLYSLYNFGHINAINVAWSILFTESSVLIMRFIIILKIKSKYNFR
jgi:PST family polysaccharide transporter